MTESSRDRGREIDVVPLCANCLVEAEVDELDDHAVLQKGLRRMDHTDGGMGRMRWERQKLERLRSRRYPEPGKQLGKHIAQHPTEEDLQPLDGAARTEACSTPLDSTIYVSMSNPLGEPAFKPSPTKSIPRWMQYLPEYRQTYHSKEPRRSTSALMSQEKSIKSRTSSGISTRTVCPPKVPTPVSTPPPLSPRSSSKTFSSTSCFDDSVDPMCAPLDIRSIRQQPISWVSHEPLKRPSSRMTYKQAHETSETEASSAYGTPPEFTPEEAEQRARAARHGSPHRRPGHDERRAPYRPQSPLSAPVVVTMGQSHRHDAIRPTVRTPPPLSSEYLEKYRPIRSPSPKPAAGFREPMAMIEAMRRESLATSSSASTVREQDSFPDTPSRRRGDTLQPSMIQDQMRARGGHLRKVSTMGSQQKEAQAPVDGADSLHSSLLHGHPGSAGKRKHLQSELKKLFGKY